MIVIDSSALVAILNHEPGRTTFFEAIAAADRCLVSAVTYRFVGRNKRSALRRSLKRACRSCLLPRRAEDNISAAQCAALIAPY
jgi:uncharacterized protein with PIN domain